MLSVNETTPQRARAVSVIIPTFNTARYLDEALRSVFAQTFGDFEVIVINDGSPDTAELERVLTPYGPAVTYLKQDNRGPSSARNLGIRQACGRYIALLDSDDVWEPEYLAFQVARFEADPTLAVSYTNARIFGDSLDAGRNYMDVHPSDGEVTLCSLIEQRCNVLSGAVVRREALFSAGLYNETLRIAEDLDLWLRIVAQGGRIVYDRRPLCHYRKHDKSSTLDPLVMWENYLRVIRIAQHTLNLTAEEREVAAQRVAYVGAMLKFFEGKQAFFAGQTERAIELLKQANASLQSRKLSLTIHLLRLSPQMLLRAYEARDRWVFGRSTKI